VGEGHRGDTEDLLGSGDAMKQPQTAVLSIMVCASWFMAGNASADVNLVLRAKPQQANVGMDIEVGLYAVSSEGTDFIALDAILAWDPSVLRLRGVDASVHNWFLFGFLDDSGLDGLNADCGEDVFCKTFTGLPWNDGDALLQALILPPPGSSGIVATEDGVLITTITFTVERPAVASEITFLPSAGDSSLSRVLRSGGANVTGSLGAAFVNVGPNLRAVDVHMAAGGTAEVWVLGEITQLEIIGVTVLASIETRQGNAGTVNYTPAPPVDVAQRGDPWPETGTFSAFDTDTVLTDLLNGALDDNGTFLPEVLDYSGPLVSFPITASSDATGTWDIRLCEDPCGTEDGSFWNSVPSGIPTARRHGIVRIVDWGDGNDSQTIDLRDQSEFLACFTGGGAADPPAYSLAPELRCSVYDFDGNGAINLDDFEQMFQARSGP